MRNSEPKTLTELETLLSRRFLELTGTRVRDCSIEFYRYSRFTSTIRLRNDRLRVRLSDLLEDAAPEIIESFSLKLLHRLTRTRVPRGIRQCCNEFSNDPETIRREREMRRLRGRKRCFPPAGEVFDLEPLFGDLNRTFFQGALQLRRLGWSMTKSTRRLGHYDPAHDAIVLSRRLDNPLVPEYVVRFILYHEMLHAHLGELPPDSSGRRTIHGRAFRRAEKSHPDYRRALEFIHRHFRP